MNEFLSLTGETREIKKDREEKKVCKSGVEKETNIDRVPYFLSYRKDTEHLYHAFMYSLVILLSNKSVINYLPRCSYHLL